MGPDTQGTTAINLRLPRALLGRAEAVIPAAGSVAELATLPRVTRSDVVRVALARGLAELEGELRGAGPQLPLE